MLYNVVFSGQLRPGFDKEQVRQHLRDLFKLSEHMIEAIFIAQRTVIKRDIDLGVARKYEQKLFLHGMIVTIEPTEAEGTTTAELAETSEAAPLNAVTNATTEPVAARDELASDAVSVADQTPTPVHDIESPPPVAPAAENVSRDEQGDYPQVIPFQFTGNGKEYFKIWIVNIVLTIITLGIYSAWAKVRNQQYFYGNTTLDGGSFEYLADPKKILIGRIIAVVIFVAYSAAMQLLPTLMASYSPALIITIIVVLMLAFLLVIPWMIIRSLAFNAYNSTYRNIRFTFKGSYKDALIAFVLWPLAAIPTLGLLFPLAYKKQQEFIVSNSGYGTTQFDFGASAKQYYIIFGILLAITIAVGFLASIAAGLFASMGNIGMVITISSISYILIYLVIFVFIAVKTTNVGYNNTYLSEHNFSADYQLGSYAILLVTNTLAIMFTLGLFTPWAKVRAARYKAEHIQVVAMSSFDQFVADQSEQVDAFAEGVSDVFDFDVGL